MMSDPINNTIQLASTEVPAPKATIENTSPKNVRWRYKHMGNKYILKASLNKKQ